MAYVLQEPPKKVVIDEKISRLCHPIDIPKEDLLHHLFNRMNNCSQPLWSHLKLRQRSPRDSICEEFIQNVCVNRYLPNGSPKASEKANTFTLPVDSPQNAVHKNHSFGTADTADTACSAGVAGVAACFPLRNIVCSFYLVVVES